VNPIAWVAGDAGGWDRVLFSCEEADVVNTDTDLEWRTVELGGM